MNARIKMFLKKTSIITASVASSLALLAGGTTALTLLQPVSAAADAAVCPQDSAPETNIIYCGLSGGNDSHQLMLSFQQAYNANSDGNAKNPNTHTDLQRVYKEVSTMNGNSFSTAMFTTGQWQVGTSSHDGNIRDSKGAIVGTNTMITSRCYTIGDNSSYNCQTSQIQQGLYKPLKDGSGSITNVYYRSATWFFDKNTDTMPTLLHFNKDNVLDFAIWRGCGNALIFKAVVPQKSLVCKSLDYKQVSSTDNTVDYAFTATATEQNTNDITYSIQYSNGGNDQIVVHDGTTQVTFKQHTFNTDTAAKYTVSVQTNGQPQVSTCTKSFSFTPKTTPTFACKALTGVLNSGSSQSGQETYTFTATTQGTENVAASNGYQFFYKEDTGGYVSTGAQTSNTFQHQFVFSTDTTHTFNIYFVATSTSGLKTDAQDTNCAYSFSNIPTPPATPNTGPGDTFMLVAGVTTLGAGIHQAILRRRLS